MENQLDTVQSTKDLCNQLFDLVEEYSVLDGAPSMEYQLEYLKGLITYLAIQDPGIAFRVQSRVNILNKELQTSRPYLR
jgi:hypothetical protein